MVLIVRFPPSSREQRQVQGQDARERLLANGQRPSVAGGVRRPQRPGHERFSGEQGERYSKEAGTAMYGPLLASPRGAALACFNLVPRLQAYEISISAASKSRARVYSSTAAQGAHMWERSLPSSRPSVKGHGCSFRPKTHSGTWNGPTGPLLRGFAASRGRRIAPYSVLVP